MHQYCKHTYASDRCFSESASRFSYCARMAVTSLLLPSLKRSRSDCNSRMRTSSRALLADDSETAVATRRRVYTLSAADQRWQPHAIEVSAIPCSSRCRSFIHSSRSSDARRSRSASPRSRSTSAAAVSAARSFSAIVHSRAVLRFSSSNTARSRASHSDIAADNERYDSTHIAYAEKKAAVSTNHSISHTS